MIDGMTGAGDLQDLIHSFRISAALSVAAELGISDLLATGPRSLTIWRRRRRPTRTPCGRLLRALVALGVYAEPEDGTFAATALGDGLRSDVPGSLRPLARTLQDPAIWSAWGHLAHSVRTGENAFEALHGVDVWTHREAPPGAERHLQRQHDLAQLPRRRRESPRRTTSPASRRWSTSAAARASCWRRSSPGTTHLTGTVFDLPHVVASEPDVGRAGDHGGRRPAAASSSRSRPRTPISSSRSCTTGRTTSASRSSAAAARPSTTVASCCSSSGCSASRATRS